MADLTWKEAVRAVKRKRKRKNQLRLDAIRKDTYKVARVHGYGHKAALRMANLIVKPPKPYEL